MAPVQGVFSEKTNCNWQSIFSFPRYSQPWQINHNQIEAAGRGLPMYHRRKMRPPAGMTDLIFQFTQLDWTRALVGVPVTSTTHKQTVHSCWEALAGVIKVAECHQAPHWSLLCNRDHTGYPWKGRVTMQWLLDPWREHSVNYLVRIVFVSDATGIENGFLVWVDTLWLMHKEPVTATVTASRKDLSSFSGCFSWLPSYMLLGMAQHVCLLGL